VIFAHSARDGLLVLIALLQVGLTGYAIWAFPVLEWPALVGLGAALVFLTCTSYQCVAHNQIHAPFFKWKLVNRLFTVLNSFCLGMPGTLYRFHHLNHHRFNNDEIDSETGTTRDDSSIFRHGKNGAEESLITYALFGLFRTDVVHLYREAAKKKLGGWVLAETLFVLAAVGALFAWNWQAALTLYVPVWVLGQVGAFAENYLEHHGATPGDRKTDSVSSYAWLYNLIWFNNGYHQEHHLKPQVHWTQIKAVREELPPDTERKVVAGAHWFNLRGALFPKAPKA
jgi:fatty acid desaturase